MSADRRKRRSDDPLQAAELYLASAAKRRSFQALTLSDDNGVIVADAPTALNSEALAVIASIAVEEEQTGEGLLDLVTRGEQLHVRNIELGGRTHFLSAVGQSELPASEAERALRRILC